MIPPVEQLEPRWLAMATGVPIEAQGWWERPDDPGQMWHEHVAIVAPIGQKVSGAVHLDVRVTLHDDPAASLTVIAANDGRRRLHHYVFVEQPSFEQAGSTRSFSYPLTIDTTRQPDGWKTLSVRANVQAGGEEFFTEVEFGYYSQNGNRRRDQLNKKWADDTTSWRASSWSESSGYHRVVLRSTLTAAIAIDTELRYRFSSGDRLWVAIDRSHEIPAVGSWVAQVASAGCVIVDRPESTKAFVVTLDPGELSPGWHSIQVRVSNSENSFPQAVTWFVVAT